MFISGVNVKIKLTNLLGGCPTKMNQVTYAILYLRYPTYLNQVVPFFNLYTTILNLLYTSERQVHIVATCSK